MSALSINSNFPVKVEFETVKSEHLQSPYAKIFAILGTAMNEFRKNCGSEKARFKDVARLHVELHKEIDQLPNTIKEKYFAARRELKKDQFFLTNVGETQILDQIHIHAILFFNNLNKQGITL